LKTIKRRYLAIQIEMETVPNEREFLDAVWTALTRLFGEVGASKASLALINYDVDQKLAILRTNASVADNLRASIATITSICGKAATLHVLAVSGTIKSLHAKL
jgi:ribonuclease P/MRP protein subunit POP5